MFAQCQVAFIVLWLMFSTMLVPKTGQTRAYIPPVLQVEESKPITINGAKFSTVTEANWHPVERPTQVKMPIELRLRITNLTKSDVVFPTNGTFIPVIRDQHGHDLKPGFNIDTPLIPRPILIPAGGTFSIARPAYLVWDPKTNENIFSYGDGTGAWWEYGPLSNQTYKVSFLYSTKRGDGSFIKPPPGNSVIWQGQVKTPEVIIDVVNPKKQGKGNTKGK